MNGDLQSVAPTTYIIFGATGDLAQRKLFPALFDLYHEGRLPKIFRISAFSRRDLTDGSFREMVRKNLAGHTRETSNENQEDFLRLIFYVKGFFDESNSYLVLAKRLAEEDAHLGGCTNKLFHLAVHPDFYETVLRNLSTTGLTIPCGGKKGFTRVLVEKPFGKDDASAKKLDTLLGELFKEEQIFRIDHYLAKETVQNLLAFRHFNRMFDPLWNSKHISGIHIRFFEESTIGERGNFYDTVGALRDVGQNHMLQLLALVMMDLPAVLGTDSIRKARQKIINELETISPARLPRFVARAQYKGFRKEEGVGADSTTETYFLIRTGLRSARWRGVPVFLEGGKAMKESRVDITITFKGAAPTAENAFVFHIQPRAGIEIKILAKKPGLQNEVLPRMLSFDYAPEEGAHIPDAYARVIFDCIRGDQTLFASTKEVEAEWKFITPILKQLHTLPLLIYDKGKNPKKSLNQWK